MGKLFAGALGACLAMGAVAGEASSAPPRVVETPLGWTRPHCSASAEPATVHVAGHDGYGGHKGSTHEIAFEPGGAAVWVSGQDWDQLARVPIVNGAAGAPRVTPTPATDPETDEPVPHTCKRAGPHGLTFDRAGRLWVALELAGEVVQVDGKGAIGRRIDVRLKCEGCGRRGINTRPHGLWADPDGCSLWFTGKATGTVGRIDPAGCAGPRDRVSHFALTTVGSVPIYVLPGPDKAMWVTELGGNAIAHVTHDGEVAEIPIPTPNSRPIALVAGPDGAMWFSEEAGSRIGRIDVASCSSDGTFKGENCKVGEFDVPRMQPNSILAALAFDRAGDLYVEQYVDQNHPDPAGSDYIVRIARPAAALAEGRAVTFEFIPLPTRRTVLHRIDVGPDGGLWFTEMGADKLGRMGR